MKTLLLLALLPCAAMAGVGFSVEWEHPTHNVDDSKIPLDGDTAIRGTLVEWGSCDGEDFGASKGFKFVDFPDRSILIENKSLNPDFEPLVEGTTYCVRAFTKNWKDKRSDTSNIEPKVAVRL